MKFQDQKIEIEPYNPDWVKKFEKEKEILEKTLGDWVQGGIHHVGSTAIPGLDAKPIIDILIGVKNLKEAAACIPLLEKAGYHYYPYKPEMIHWFCKPSPSHREFHLQLMEPTHPEWAKRFAFRDYLIDHPADAREYSILKKQLATQNKHDREAYTEAKTEFVNAIVAKALAEK